MTGKSKLMAEWALHPPGSEAANTRSWAVYRASPETKTIKTLLITADQSKAIEAVQSGGSLCRHFEISKASTVEELHGWLQGLGYSIDDLKQVHEQMLNEVADGMVNRVFVE